jgi:exosortase
MSTGNVQLGATRATADQSSASSASDLDREQLHAWITIGALVAVLIWGYWTTLVEVARAWDNPKYSHGYLVPAFTAALIWMRREPFRAATIGARWAGVALLGVGLSAWLLFTYSANITPKMYSMVPCVMGIFLLVGGWPVLRWAGPAVLFLAFMFPLPTFLDSGLLTPLQKIATSSSNYVLQTMGIASYRDGNTIHIGEVGLNVVEACSGIRMLTIFMALAVAITLVTDRPMWERIVIVVSAVPIALLVNIIRITITGICHLTVGKELADTIFHDLAGWVMMPMALGFLYIEFQILANLVIDEGPIGPVRIGVPIVKHDAKTVSKATV